MTETGPGTTPPVCTSNSGTNGNVGTNSANCATINKYGGSTTLVPGTGNREPATVTVDEVTDEGAFRVDPAWAEAVGAPY